MKGRAFPANPQTSTRLFTSGGASRTTTFPSASWAKAPSRVTAEASHRFELGIDRLGPNAADRDGQATTRLRPREPGLLRDSTRRLRVQKLHRERNQRRVEDPRDNVPRGIDRIERGEAGSFDSGHGVKPEGRFDDDP